MNGSDGRKVVINKTKQTMGDVKGTSPNGSGSSSSKKRRKQDLRPLITGDNGRDDMYVLFPLNYYLVMADK